jgi:hypothetical protein
MFGKRAAPSICEIKDRHIEHQHGVMPAWGSSKSLTQSAPPFVFGFFGFH